MDQVSVTASMRFGRRDVFWFSLALLFHVPLFLMPLAEPGAGHKTSRTLSVILAAQRGKVPVDETRADAGTIPAATLQQPVFDPRQEEIPPPPATEPEAAVAPPVPERTISAAGLSRFAREYRWNLPEAAVQRRLGEAPSPRGTQRRQPWFDPASSLFEGSAVPEKTEVVDRWVAADGSQNVVINTASGQTLCGRAPAWDPMNPLVEHVMQFRTCGGGGQREFKMPDRYSRHLVD